MILLTQNTRIGGYINLSTIRCKMLIDGYKVQAQVQGDEVRVSGKKRDDLQAVMALIRAADLGQPFQFKNFRD